MNKYYWLIAGALVGLFSVFMMYINLQLLIADWPEDSLSWTGVVIVTLEYTALIYTLSLVQKLFKK
jgi:hypothetical protein